LIVGDHDLVDAGATVAQQWCAGGDLTCRMIPDAGHLCWVDEPRLVRSALLDALGVH
jgi:pimeloyl-ACP methyl ester carboxylesterase